MKKLKQKQQQQNKTNEKKREGGWLKTAADRWKPMK